MVAARTMATGSVEQILGITERVLDVPIRAVVGGLHLPVHAAAEGAEGQHSSSPTTAGCPRQGLTTAPSAWKPM